LVKQGNAVVEQLNATLDKNYRVKNQSERDRLEKLEADIDAKIAALDAERK
jgi:hypothetical protein